MTTSTAQATGFARVSGAVWRTDVAFALALMAILLVLMVPLPTWLLDISLALSLTISVLILMTSLFIERPLDFSSFPTLLLITTMMRLSLNVASTRLILTHGHEGPAAAGSVIKAFGAIIMQGNFVIGFIVFAILVIVNFVVITKGSGRIAEVSARFSLDSLPASKWLLMRIFPRALSMRMKRKNDVKILKMNLIFLVPWTVRPNSFVGMPLLGC